jgi:hypothetical protein
MKKFDSLLQAAAFAARNFKSWSFATSDERYDVKELLTMAEISDSENPADEDSFYVVSPGGSIGFCMDGRDIDWLFLSDAAAFEELPPVYQAAPQPNFCPKCGAPTIFGARFCGSCGQKLC